MKNRGEKRMKELKTSDRFQLSFFIDDEDYGEVIKRKWYVRWQQRDGNNSDTVNSIYCNYFAKKSKKDGQYIRGTITLHKFLMNTPKGYVIDHIDRNPCNNVRTNLRIVTHLENRANSGARLDNTSGYKGVSHNNCSKKNPWTAQINGQHIGLFPTAEEAAIAYNQAAKQYYGEFAYLNPIPGNKDQIAN